MSKHYDNILIFGPAGIGKSTVISKLGTLGFKTLDLEIFWNNNISLSANRLNLIRILSAIDSIGDKGWIIGAAGLDPKTSYPKFAKVLLTLPQANYDSRRMSRDSKKPEYGAQPKMLIEDWIKMTHWNAILNSDSQIHTKVVGLLSK